MNRHDDLTPEEQLDSLVDSARETIVEAKKLREEIHIVGEKQQQDRRAIIMGTILSLVVLCVLLLVAIVIGQVLNNQIATDNSQQVKDCIVPGGYCNQRSSAVFELNRNLTVLNIERNSLKTTAEAARAANDSARAKVYEENLVQTEQAIKQEEEALDKILSGESQPPYQLPAISQR